MPNPWVLEERMALLPVVSRALKENLRRTDLVEESLSFGVHPHQVVYLFWPMRQAARRQTAVFFLHGGGWYTGHPRYYHFVGHFFAGLGFPTLVSGYRLAPAYRYPAQVEDAYAGLEAGLRAFAMRGFPLRRVIAGGQSAGAELAALLVYDRSRRVRGVLREQQFAGFYSISGPLSFEDCVQPNLRAMIAEYMGERDDWRVADPIQYLRGDERVPALLFHGDRDPLVDLQNAIAFAERLKQSPHSSVELRVVQGGHHADLAAIFVDEMQERSLFEQWLIQCDQH